MNRASPILDAQDMTLASWEPAAPPIVRDATFAIGPGQVALIEGLASRASERWAHALSGLEPPDAGAVRFEGRPWEALTPYEAAAARALRLGRVFAGTAWLSNLDVSENITLPARHFTNRPEAELLDAAGRLARSLGLGGVPDGRPAWVDERELQLAQWTRALLNRPVLLLIEHPLAHLRADDVARVMEILQGVRREGTGGVWLTPGADDALVRMLRPDCRFRVSEGRWLQVDLPDHEPQADGSVSASSLPSPVRSPPPSPSNDSALRPPGRARA